MQPEFVHRLKKIDIGPSSFHTWPNMFVARCRQAEFARAALAKLLESPNATKTAKYVGLVREEKVSELRSALESQVYNWWETRLWSCAFCVCVYVCMYVGR